jgi:subtilisin family serine protease
VRSSSEPGTRGRGGRRRPARLVSLVAVTALAFVPGARSQLPCGIARPVDDLLACRDSAPTQVSDPAAGQPARGSAPAAAVSAATVQSTSEPALAEVAPAPTSTQPRFLPNRLLVRFRTGTTAARQDAALAAAHVTRIGRIGGIGVVVVSMTPSERETAMAELRSSPAVGSVGRDQVLDTFDVTPNDADWSTQWGLRQVGLPLAWERTRGTNVVVAVLDTGVDAAHPDLQGAVLPGFNLVDPSAPPSDDNGHGTAVAGIIAARTDNHIGVAGICWTCSILPVKVLGADGTGDTATVAAGIIRAADAGARVISMSFGGPAPDPTLSSAVAYAEAKGAILVAAAGNSGSSVPFYPAADPGVISVAATDESNHLYDWSDYGPWVQVAAPGCDSATGSSGGYVDFCGTSAAAPVVSGIAALALSVVPDASRNQVVAAVEGTATSIGDGTSSGLVDASNALGALGVAVPAPVQVLTANGSLRVGAKRGIYRFAVPAGLLAVKLAYTGGRRLVLSVRTTTGTLVGSASGASPLELSAVVPAESLVASVTGSAPASYHLTVSVTQDAITAGKLQ